MRLACAIHSLILMKVLAIIPILLHCRSFTHKGKWLFTVNNNNEIKKKPREMIEAINVRPARIWNWKRLGGIDHHYSGLKINWVTIPILSSYFAEYRKSFSEYSWSIQFLVSGWLIGATTWSRHTMTAFIGYEWWTRWDWHFLWIVFLVHPKKAHDENGPHCNFSGYLSCPFNNSQSLGSDKSRVISFVCPSWESQQMFITSV